MTRFEALEQLGLTDRQYLAATAYQALHGGDSLWALEATLNPEEIQEVWGNMAARRGWPYFPDHRSLRSIEGHRLDRRLALHLGVSPHREEYTDLCLLTPDPHVPLAPIHTALGPHVKLHLVPPAVYDRVSQLTYPAALWGTLTEAEALALATARHIGLYEGKTVQQCLSEKQITHDQAARAHATLLRLPYADVRRMPPDPTLLSLLPVDTQRHLRVYPYRLIDGVLSVLVDQPDQRALQLLTMTMQREVRPVITATPALRQLLGDDEAAPAEEPQEPVLARA